MDMHVDTLASLRPATRRNGTTRTLNLALQGAGSHGAFCWGILDKLLEDGRIEIDGITATSAGAYCAVVYAYGFLRGGKDNARTLLERFWRKVSEESAWIHPLRYAPMAVMFGEPASWRWFEHMTQVLSPYEFNPLNLDPARSVLESLVDFEELYRARATPLVISATHVRSGRKRIFTNREITAKAVAAAACQPALSQAVEIDGEHYWDGVYGAGQVLAPLIARSSSRDVLIGQISPVLQRDMPRRAPQIQARAAEIATHASLLCEARALTAAASLIDESWIKPEHRHRLSPARFHAISADDVMSDVSAESKFDMSGRALRRLRDMGRHAADLWLETHFESVGQRSTIHFGEQ
jgi:NTE family protein